MRPSYRLTAAVSSVLLLQLSLLGSGALCTLHADHGTDINESYTGQSAHMASHADRGEAALGTASHAGAHRDQLSRAPLDGGNDSCHHPQRSGPCASMTSCTPPVAAPTSGVALVVSIIGVTNLPEPSFGDSELTLAPEFPPPRA